MKASSTKTICNNTPQQEYYYLSTDISYYPLHNTVNTIVVFEYDIPTDYRVVKSLYSLVTAH